jgi:lipopolysaccharide export system protein LptC
MKYRGNAIFNKLQEICTEKFNTAGNVQYKIVAAHIRNYKE